MSEVVDENYHCETCYKCGVKFWMPLALHETALIRREEFDFWCPNGHGQHFNTTEDDEDEPRGEVVTFPVISGGKP